MTNPTEVKNDDMWIGIGKQDITGPVAGYTFMGYARIEQQGIGLFNRLFSRAFIVADKQKSRHSLIVHLDMHSVSTYVRQRVMAALREEYGEIYTEDNVLLHAQHTHSGPSGYFTYYMYYLTTWGFHEPTVNTLLQGILASIRQAHANMTPGYLELSVGELSDTGKQRSMEAYLRNPKSERDRYEHDHETTMTNIAFRGQDGSLMGVFNLFPVHPTNFVGDNGMISSDNKGYAEWLLEKKYPGSVFAFGQSNSGDISPNHVDNGDGTFSGEEANYVSSAEQVGRRQADAAERLTFDDAAGRDRLSPLLLFRTRYVDFSNIELQDGTHRTTCPAVIGQTFLAGTEDGRGVPMMREGVTYNNPLALVVGHVLFSPIPEDVAKCHLPKLPGLGPGVMEPLGSPKVLPIQVMRIGELAIVAVPFEVTSMAGRRLREVLLQDMSHDGVRHVALAANSNAYAGYQTTAEEYASQHYEGASTHFGPNQLEALIQEASVTASLLRPGSEAEALNTGKWSKTSEPITPEFVDTLPRSNAFVPFDVTPNLQQEFGEPAFGGLLTKGNSFSAGKSIVTVAFWGAHPENQFSQVKSFCDVERQGEDGTWSTVLQDSDWTLRFYWRRRLYVLNLAYCEWAIDGSIPAGQYRIAYNGVAKHLGGSFDPFTGYSPEFFVQPMSELSLPVEEELDFLRYERHTEVGHLQIRVLENIINSASLALLIFLFLTVRFCTSCCLRKGRSAKPFKPKKN